jgi:hypothetical protein
VSEPDREAAIVESILSGHAPPHVRAAAARGALPLPRATLVRIFVALRQDDDEGVRAAAEASLGQLDAKAIEEVLAAADCSGDVLGYFAPRAARETGLAERIVFNRETPRSAMLTLAAKGNAPVIELVLTNQERLLSEPEVLELLIVNPMLRADQRGRILELLDRAAKLKEQATAKSAGAETRDAEEVEEVDAEEMARLLDVDVGELLSASEILGAEELEASEDVELRSAFQRILNLTTAQKAILAMKGGREERQILIRDTNRVVALGVLKNGRITDDEIETIARMRNVTDVVLQTLGTNREWTKSYNVMLALVQNPRTPQMISTNFVSRLTNKDLKNLVRSREVPELIRRMARRTHDLRTQKSNAFRKK